MARPSPRSRSRRRGAGRRSRNRSSRTRRRPRSMRPPQKNVMRLRSATLVLLLLAAVAACRKPGDVGAQGTPRPGSQEVVVYSSADKEFSELIFKAYEAKSGVKVLPVYDTEE